VRGEGRVVLLVWEEISYIPLQRKFNGSYFLPGQGGILRGARVVSNPALINANRYPIGAVGLISPDLKIN